MKTTPELARDRRSSIMQIAGYDTENAVNLAVGVVFPVESYTVARVTNTSAATAFVGNKGAGAAYPSIAVTTAGSVGDGTYTYARMVNAKARYEYLDQGNLNYIEWNGSHWKLVIPYDDIELYHLTDTGALPPVTGWDDGPYMTVAIVIAAPVAQAAGEGLPLAPGESLHMTLQAGSVLQADGTLTIVALGA